MTSLAIGHDGVNRANVVAVDIGGTRYERLERLYRVRNSGNVGNVSVEFDLAGTGVEFLNSGVALLIDDDITSLADATLHTFGRTINGTSVTFTGVNFSDGNFFTLVLQETPSVTLSAAVSIGEAAGSTPVTVTLSHASNFNNSISLGFSGTAVGGGTDYTMGTVIAITSGNTSR